ncbi:MAG: LEA type 2 family protein [Gemmatimonadota bacterium]
MMVGAMRRVMMVTLLCASTALTGCATAARAVFTQPDVTFRGVGLRSLSVDGAELEVLLNIYNPNAYSLGASALHYRLLVDSLELGAGAIDSAFSVAKRDSAVVRLPVRLGFRALQRLGPQLLRGGEVPYRLMGDVTLKSFVGTFTREFSETGMFDARKTFRQ